jgi:glutamate racemase
MSIRRQRVLMFDSGAGGLSVARSVRVQLGEVADLIYAADTAGFPYGRWSEVMLVRRILKVMRELVSAVQPDCVVIACNTASTLALDVLREEFRVPFVGTVPAIKPAAAQTQTGVIGVLATPGTVKREYTRTLIHTYAFHCKVLLHGAPNLAEIAERQLAGEPVNPDQLLAEIKPVFRTRGGNRTDVVVLGCTHYPLVLDELKQVAPWPVEWIDPAPAIARRTAFILADRGAHQQPGEGSDIAPDTVIFTSAPAGGQAPAGFRAMGFNTLKVLDIPV